MLIDIDKCSDLLHDCPKCVLYKANNKQLQAKIERLTLAKEVAEAALVTQKAAGEQLGRMLNEANEQIHFYRFQYKNCRKRLKDQDIELKDLKAEKNTLNNNKNKEKL
jgi:chromosome segregation ATPase